MERTLVWVYPESVGCGKFPMTHPILQISIASRDRDHTTAGESERRRIVDALIGGGYQSPSLTTSPKLRVESF